MSKKRYVLVGVGGRARFFYEALVTNYKETSELVAFCDINQTRMDYAMKYIKDKHDDYHTINSYLSHEFDEMIEKEKPDVVIVTTVDRTHHKYINRAMELGCDVISEKPMTTDAEKCQSIIDKVKETGKNLRVTFNYRYSPYNTKVRELILNNKIGDVTSIHFEWLLNTSHGADYFRRWHRDKLNSGGLLVHKSTHHFDLVNFWLGSQPETVFAMGDLRFYGRENAENRGVTEFYYRGIGSENAKNDPFALDLNKNDQLRDLYLNAEKEDGYLRDQSVFGDGISIEDTMGVIVRYKNKAILTYSLNAYLPWEGYRVAINGTKGRIEVDVSERSYINSSGDAADEGSAEKKKITVYPMHGKPYDVEVEEFAGGHGGGDPRLLDDIFGDPDPDPFKRAASHIDGAMSVLTGVAGNISMNTGQPVKVNELVKF